MLSHESRVCFFEASVLVTPHNLVTEVSSPPLTHHYPTEWKLRSFYPSEKNGVIQEGFPAR